MIEPKPTLETIAQAGSWLMRELWDDIPCADPDQYTKAMATFITNGLTLCGGVTGHKLIRRIRHYVRGFYQTGFQKPTHTTGDRIGIEMTLGHGLLLALGYFQGRTPTTELYAGHYQALSEAIYNDEQVRQRPDRLYQPGDILIRPYTQFCYN